MHNLTKIKIFRTFLWIVYPFALIFIYPFAALSKKKSASLFFFFDRYAIGGAQQVHLDILRSINDTKKQVYFTRYSPDDTLKKIFYDLPNTDCRDIHIWCDYLFFRLITVHFFAFYINRHNQPQIFSSNSTFFYDMLPFLNKKVKTTELLHNFSYGKKGFEFFGLANYKYIDIRIVIDAITRDNIKKQYAEYHVPAELGTRILLTEPGVDFPLSKPAKDPIPPLKVLYAGRGGPQKRVWLINRVAEHFISRKLPVEFHFAGSMFDELSETVTTNSIWHGQISEKEKMNALYNGCHVILLTSAYEGFPMLIKEGMASGCVPVVTALEGNKTHLQNGVNALLIEAVENEGEVVQGAISHITALMEQPALLRKLSDAAYAYACSHFTKEMFMVTYRTLLSDGMPERK